ncbi:MAG: site-2 protease family protein, partial [Candidatus Omnitrophica bacterium]|nr:site-2 protease family protein [Candidatus Omnitrophota bacterium]
YWWMGIGGSLGLFLSIVFHEAVHSLVARRFGMEMRGITLFIFGGIAHMSQEPPDPKAEFLMAAAGPASSIFLGFVFHLAALALPLNPQTIGMIGLLRYLRWINWALAVFNLLPAFPLDGGRILRSALWKWKNDINFATRISSRLGSVFGFVISFLGVLNIFAGAFIAGMWWLLIGMFLRGASQASYQNLLIVRAFKGETVGHFMQAEPVTVPLSISVRKLIEDYIYKYHHKMFPVVEEDKLVGCVSTREIKEVPKQEWEEKKVKDIVKKCSPGNTVSPDTDAMTALSIINRTKNGRLLVTEGDKLAGIITLKDLMGFFSLKIDLEEKELE